MTTDAVCARPVCAFVPMPKMNESGALETSVYCSDSCALFTAWAATLAAAEPCDETERQLLMLYHTGMLLSLRRHPGEYEEPLVNVANTGVNDVGR